MRAVLAAEIGEHVVVTITMTKEEIADSGALPEALAEAVRGVCGAPAEDAVNASAAAEEAEAEPETQEEEAPAQMLLADFRDLQPENVHGSKEDILERAMDELIARSRIPVSAEEIEEEANYELLAVMQKMRYDVMFGRGEPVDADPEELKKEITESVIREKKEEIILQNIIAREKIEALPEELFAEAEAMAERQETSLDMIRSFFGEDLQGLAGDVQRRKAKDLIYDAVMRCAQKQNEQGETGR